MTEPMNDPIPTQVQNGERGDQAEVAAQWAALERNLGAYLATMTAPDERDHLILELPHTGDEWLGGSLPYAQFAIFDEGRMIRAELTGDANLAPAYRLGEVAVHLLRTHGWLGNDTDTEDQDKHNWYREHPVGDAAEVAHLVVVGLRDAFGIAHPELLTHHAWGAAAAGIGVLGLCATADIPSDDPHAPAGSEGRAPARPAPSREAFQPSSRGELAELVAEVLRDRQGEEPVVDDDGDFVIHHAGQPLWIRMRTDQPAVEIFGRVVHEVRSKRGAAIELSVLNRDVMWVHWCLRDRAVWQSASVMGVPFVPWHLTSMLDVFVQALDETRDDLAFRLGAKVG